MLTLVLIALCTALLASKAKGGPNALGNTPAPSPAHAIRVSLERLGSRLHSTARTLDGYPITLAAKRWKPDRDWLRGAFCIHRHESVDWHLAYRDWAGNSSPYSGGMQFLQSTWLRAGGKGHAYQWSPREQLYRAFIIWRAGGGSWREWGTAGACGLR